MAWFWSISLSFVLFLISRVVASRFADVRDWIASTPPSPHIRGSAQSSPSYEPSLVAVLISKLCLALPLRQHWLCSRRPIPSYEFSSCLISPEEWPENSISDGCQSCSFCCLLRATCTVGLRHVWFALWCDDEDFKRACCLSAISNEATCLTQSTS